MAKNKIYLDPSDIFWLMRRTLDYSGIETKGIGEDVPDTYCIACEMLGKDYEVFYNGEEVIGYGKYKNPIEAFVTFVDLQTNNYIYAKMTGEKLLQNIRERQAYYKDIMKQNKR